MSLFTYQAQSVNLVCLSSSALLKSHFLGRCRRKEKDLPEIEYVCKIKSVEDNCYGEYLKEVGKVVKSA